MFICNTPNITQVFRDENPDRNIFKTHKSAAIREMSINIVFSDICKGELMKLMVMLIVFFLAQGAYSEIPDPGYHCEGIKVVSNGNPAEDIKTGFSLSPDPDSPWKMVAELDGLKFEGIFMRESVMFPQAMSVSITSNGQTSSSMGTDSVNITLAKADEKQGVMYLWGAHCQAQ